MYATRAGRKVPIARFEESSWPVWCKSSVPNHEEGLVDGGIEAHQTAPAKVVPERIVLVLSWTVISMTLHHFFSIALSGHIVMQHGGNFISALAGDPGFISGVQRPVWTTLISSNAEVHLSKDNNRMLFSYPRHSAPLPIVYTCEPQSNIKVIYLPCDQS